MDASERSAELEEILLNAEHMGPWEEFLTVAARAGFHRPLLLKLIELQRVDKAVQEAPKVLSKAADILAVAQALERVRTLDAAWPLAKRGLEIEELHTEFGRRGSERTYALDAARLMNRSKQDGGTIELRALMAQSVLLIGDFSCQLCQTHMAQKPMSQPCHNR